MRGGEPRTGVCCASRWRSRVSAPRSGAADIPGPRAAPRPRVLVAEDDADFRGFVVGTLTAAGYEVSEAKDGGDLLERVADASVHSGIDLRPFSVVVTDLHMPGLSGMDALEFLRAGPWRGTPVIVMTAFGDSLTHDRAHRLGAVTVLDKPFEASELRRAVSLVAPTA